MDTNIMRTLAKRTVKLLTLSGGTDSPAIDMKDYNGLLASITADDVAFLEISDAEIAQAGTDAGFDDLRYCKVEVTGTDTDLIVLVMEQGRAHLCADGLTADVITA